ncbi:hypothetical protein C8N24_3846 [Solirubrobacter pauli]|uniref:Uncharacterized protein n=1 Tax=Solirubrobacter pauli TaxID=166793 RepID=A0A660LIQ7_9ACTN|nr:hypothetical protein [Solirubrobacter pauli]RKQ93970.1 hypothetical protein C8N24_3846 [Solirubrobacter pauli]
MTKIPALREALESTAERHYARRRLLVWPRRVLIPSAVAVAVWLAFSTLNGRSPESNDEVAATPTPVPHTVKVTTKQPPATSNKTVFVRASLLDGNAAVEAFRAETGANGQLDHAWRTPGMQGEQAHVFLYRRGGERCLSVVDPSASEPGDRGVGCSDDVTFRRFGVSSMVGTNYAAVIPDGRPAPVYRDADGHQRKLKIADGGLVAITGAPGGASVTLHGPRATQRADAFPRSRPMTLYSCSNGKGVAFPADAPKPASDPCATVGSQG